MGRHVVALEVWKRLVVEPKAPAQPEVLSMHSLRLPNTNPTQTQTQIGLVLGPVLGQHRPNLGLC